MGYVFTSFDRSMLRRTFAEVKAVCPEAKANDVGACRSMRSQSNSCPIFTARTPPRRCWRKNINKVAKCRIGFKAEVKRDLAEIRRRIKWDIERLRTQQREQASLLARIRRIRGRRWVRAQKCDLVKGKLYFVRGTTGDYGKPKVMQEDVAVCEWSPQGWKDVYGTLYRGAAIDNTIMVWR